MIRNKGNITALSSNGRISDSESEDRGSIPWGASNSVTKSVTLIFNPSFFVLQNLLDSVFYKYDEKQKHPC